LIFLSFIFQKFAKVNKKSYLTGPKRKIGRK